MILTPANFDYEDQVMLSYSVITCVRAQDNLRMDLLEITRVVREATQKLPALVEELRDDWDGVMWFERLESTESDSLAASLAWCASPDHNLDLTSVITLWLRRNGL